MIQAFIYKDLFLSVLQHDGIGEWSLEGIYHYQEKNTLPPNLATLEWKDDQLKCDNCGRIFRSLKHGREVEGKCLYPCSYCEQAFTTAQLLSNHVFLRHKDVVDVRQFYETLYGAKFAGSPL
jgi:uncharacterized C2H2 Zn-finger protein